MASNMKGYYAKRGLKPGRRADMTLMETVVEGQEAHPLSRAQSQPALKNTTGSLRSGTQAPLSKAGLLALSSSASRSTAASSTGSLCSRCKCGDEGCHSHSHPPGSSGGHSSASRMSRMSKGSGLSGVKMYDGGEEKLPRTPASSFCGTSVSRTSTQLRSEVEAMVQEEMAKVVNPLKEQLKSEALARVKAEERLQNLENVSQVKQEG